MRSSSMDAAKAAGPAPAKRSGAERVRQGAEGKVEVGDADVAHLPNPELTSPIGT